MRSTNKENLDMEEHPVHRFKRPIYGVLVFYGVGILCFVVIAQSYFVQKSKGTVEISTKAAFWTLAVLLTIGFLKLIIDLVRPSTRKWMLAPKEVIKDGNQSSFRRESRACVKKDSVDNS